MKTLRKLEQEARDWQQDAALAHRLAITATRDSDRIYWQIKGRKYTALAIAALDACNIMRSWE